MNLFQRLLWRCEEWYEKDKIFFSIRGVTFLAEELKTSLVDEIMFPNEGGASKEFDVIGETK